MATIDDFGSTGQALNSPKLGGPDGWAAAVRDSIRELQGRPLMALQKGTVGTGDADFDLAQTETGGYRLDMTLPALGDATVGVDALIPGAVGHFDVRSFGAVGDRTTDDTAAFQAAIDATRVPGAPGRSGRKIKVPPGRYRIEGTLDLPIYTCIEGTVGEFGSGSEIVTELYFPTDANNQIGIDAAAFCAIRDIRLTGPYTATHTTRGINGSSITIDNVSIAGFFYGVYLEGGYYSSLNAVEPRDCHTAINLRHCNNVNIRDVKITALDDKRYPYNVGVYMYDAKANIFGGAIENVELGINLSAASTVHAFGTYFEQMNTLSGESFGIYAGRTSGCTAVAIGCTVYLNNLTFFYGRDTATNLTLTAAGNTFCSGPAEGKWWASGKAYSVLPNEATSFHDISGDNWQAVLDPGCVYFDGESPYTNSHVSPPANLPGGTGANTYVGRHQVIADGSNLILGSSTGTKFGTAAGQKIGFFGAPPVARPTVTGSRGSNAALASLLTQLAALGLITDSSS